MRIPNLFKIIPEPLGLDLSDRSIKIVKLAKKGEYFSLENFGEIAVGEGILQDGVIHSETKLANVLKKTFTDLRVGSITSPYVACSLPEQKTYLRVVQLPKMSKEDVRDAIQWELEANIPLSLDEVYFDWEIIDTVDSKTNHFDILVSASPRRFIDSYINLFNKAGLKLLSLEPESLALARSIIVKGSGKEGVMLIDIGLTHMCVAIHAGYSVRFASSTPKVSGYVMTEAIAGALKVDQKKAEKMKKDVGLDKKHDKRVFKALKPVMDEFRKYLDEYIKFYEAHAGHTHDGRSISKILLSGGDSLLNGIEEYLAASTNIRVERADPWVNILDPKGRGATKMPRKESIRYAVALGLALANL